jgi:AcrR family transcriptional regulator
MGRARKDPAGRRADLMEAATRLFARRGLEETAVSDIVAAAGVAQGTFYLYFESKADLVNAVVVRVAERIVEGVTGVATTEGRGALDKLLTMRDDLLSVVTDDRALLEFFHRPGNEAFHDRVSRDAVRLVVPAFQGVIEQGVAEGVFHISHPDDAARFIAALLDVTDPFDVFAEPERLGHHAEGLTEFMLRGLGCDEPTIAREIARVRARG